MRKHRATGGKMGKSRDQESEFDNLFENDNSVNKSRLEQKENWFWVYDSH
jgi:hypothetical protein